MNLALRLLNLILFILFTLFFMKVNLFNITVTLILFSFLNSFILKNKNIAILKNFKNTKKPDFQVAPSSVIFSGPRKICRRHFGNQSGASNESKGPCTSLRKLGGCL